MPVFLSSLLGGLVSAAGSIVGRILISLGIAYVTYEGVDALLDGIKADAVARLMDLPPDVLTIAGLLQVDTAINILFSATVARLVLKGLTSGAVTKMVIR